eukprot:m.153668 g.153668  ORF g.153668 m.153668 type:complete len:367 (-) comp10175_c0_seq6:70-1170(-)
MHIYSTAALLCGLAALATAAPPRRLIELQSSNGTLQRQWLREDEIVALSQRGRLSHFMDVTDHPTSPQSAPLLRSEFPTKPVHKEYVQSLVADFAVSGTNASIAKLSSFFNRFYTTTDGRNAVLWLEQQYRAAAGERTDVTIQLFEHEWNQPSLIVTVEGGDPTYASEIVVLGGHIDSIAGGANNRAPGADDDASGSSTVLEVFRTLMRNNFMPDRTVEFHAYAAEEVGLRGSQDIAHMYAAEQRKVFSMVQFDMVGYNAGNPKAIGLIGDYTDNQLTSFLATLLDTYASTVKYVDSICGYACSDHASWNKLGYRSAFPFESAFPESNPNIHSTNDTLAHISLDLLAEFGTLGLGYVVELSYSRGH